MVGPSHVTPLSFTPAARNVIIQRTEKIIFGYDDVLRADTVIIVEGEMDKLSLNQVIRACQLGGC